MKNKEKRRLEIQELNLAGFSQEKISQKLGISISTVYRTIQKLREESNRWLVNLARRDYASLYKEALDGLKQDLVYLYELSEEESVKDNAKLRLQIRREITHVRSEYLKNLLQGPVVWSMEVLSQNSMGKSIPQPIMESLEGISGIRKC
jgi:DNA-binding transcriptional regulator LsrR (DeoR family)